MKYFLPALAIAIVATAIACSHTRQQALTVPKQEKDATRAARQLEDSMVENMSAYADPAERDTMRAQLREELKGTRAYSMNALKQHKAVTMPYVLNYDKMIASLHKEEYDPNDFATMNLIHTYNYGLFSRDVQHDYAFVAYLGENHGHYVLIYRTINNVSDDPYPEDFYLATLSKEGFLLSEQKVADLHSPLHITTATIQVGGRITTEQKNQIWEHAPEQAGYTNNKVIRSEVVGTSVYRIAGDGIITGG
jgi:hypothetical protein